MQYIITTLIRQRLDYMQQHQKHEQLLQNIPNKDYMSKNGEGVIAKEW